MSGPGYIPPHGTEPAAVDPDQADVDPAPDPEPDPDPKGRKG